MTNSAVMEKGINVLLEQLGVLDTEQFISKNVNLAMVEVFKRYLG